jgi:hypothetical protein
MWRFSSSGDSKKVDGAACIRVLTCLGLRKRHKAITLARLSPYADGEEGAAARKESNGKGEAYAGHGRRPGGALAGVDYLALVAAEEMGMEEDISGHHRIGSPTTIKSESKARTLGIRAGA